MGLRITSIGLRDFRNYEHFSLEDLDDLTVFIGKNGVGKTNLLEAVSLVTTAKTFRNAQISQLIRHGHESAHVSMDTSDGNRLLRTELFLEPGKKRFTVNGKSKGTGDIKGTLPAVSFTPDDLEMTKKSSGVRRDALDNLGTQISKNYYVILRDYVKSLKYKNRLLKEEAPQDLIDAMNETLLTCGTQLFCYRHALFNRMSQLVEERYSEISQSGEPFGSSYVPSWDYLENGENMPSIVGLGGSFSDKQRVRELLEQSLSHFKLEERARHRSLVGPHNDKIAFYLGEKDASMFASQGQQRSIVLAWKLAEVELVRQTIGMNPVLLLDDVMSELDTFRRDMLVKSVSTDIQTFITATDLSPFNDQLLSRAHVVEIG